MHLQSASSGESHVADEITDRESTEGSEKTLQTQSRGPLVRGWMEVVGGASEEARGKQKI